LCDADPKNADAHAAHAVVLYFHLEWQAATDELNIALALEPNNVDTTRIAAWFYGVLGQDDEAIRYANRAIDRDPWARGITLRWGPPPTMRTG
jgi:tetratricopeptide (TPR) repeat protein